MSFLLRNNRRNSSSNNQHGGSNRIRSMPSSDRRIIPKPRSSSLTNRNKRSSQCHQQGNQQLPPPAARKYGSGNQLLVERTVPQSKQQQRKRTTAITKDISQTQRQAAHGVISMSEVMEDLRVLEQQQRDSQRKLANARVTKDHRLQQQMTLEVQLEQQKYTNGELRAQLRQHRDFLSSGTRELGVHRLAGAKAGDDIRDFETKLKQGLQTVRMNAALRRKIDSLHITLQNKEAILRRLEQEAKEKLNIQEREYLDAQHHEQSLRASIQAEVAKAQKHSGRIAILRTENTKLEQEVLAIQSSEESTRLRVEAVDAEIVAEKKRQTQAMSELKVRLENYEKGEKEMTAEEETLAVTFEEKSRELLELKKLIVSNQEAEGQSPSEYSINFQEPVPTFDEDKIKFSLESQESQITSKKVGNDKLKQQVETLRADIQRNEEEVMHNQDQVASMIDLARHQQATEKERRQEMLSVQEKLERERESVSKLIKSTQDLLDDLDREATNRTNILADHEQAIKKDQETINRTKLKIEAEEAAAKENAAAWEIEKLQLECRMEETKEEALTTQQALNGIECKGKELMEECDTNLQETLRKLEAEEVEKMKKIDSQIANVLERYPQLNRVTFTYDPSKTREEQAEETLEDLIAECEESINDAKAARDARKQTKREARRNAEEALAVVKRKEEERHKNRERIRTEMKRQAKQEEHRKKEEERRRQTEAEEQHRKEEEDNSRYLQAEEEAIKRQREKGTRLVESDDVTTLGSIEKANRAKKKRKGAEFYCPENPSDASEDEFGSPANPKSLLDSFEGTDVSISATQQTVTTTNSDKRVRWEDQDDDDCFQDGEFSTSPPPVSKIETSNEATTHSKRQFGDSNTSKESRRLYRTKSTDIAPNKTSTHSRPDSKSLSALASIELSNKEEDIANEDSLMTSQEPKSENDRNITGVSKNAIEAFHPSSRLLDTSNANFRSKIDGGDLSSDDELQKSKPQNITITYGSKYLVKKISRPATKRSKRDGSQVSQYFDSLAKVSGTSNIHDEKPTRSKKSRLHNDGTPSSKRATKTSGLGRRISRVKHRNTIFNTKSPMLQQGTGASIVLPKKKSLSPHPETHHRFKDKGPASKKKRSLSLHQKPHRSKYKDSSVFNNKKYALSPHQESNHRSKDKDPALKKKNRSLSPRLERKKNKDPALKKKKKNRSLSPRLEKKKALALHKTKSTSPRSKMSAVHEQGRGKSDAIQRESSSKVTSILKRSYRMRESNEAATKKKRANAKRQSKPQRTSKPTTQQRSSKTSSTKPRSSKEPKDSHKSKSFSDSYQPLDLGINESSTSCRPKESDPSGKVSKSLKSVSRSRKRIRSTDISNSQTSGLSSSERVPKGRRRKKKKSFKSIEEDAYDFHF